MNFSMYPRLAWRNLIKNLKLTLPFELTCIGAVAMLYTLLQISINKGISQMQGTVYVQIVLVFGVIVIAIFSYLLLTYTNSFLIKGRRKELALYSMLGMEKKHIGRVLSFETLFMALLGIGAGLAFGMLFGRLMFLILLKILEYDPGMVYTIDAQPVWITALIFGVIFLMIQISNMRSIRKCNPMELLRMNAQSDKEPKSNIFITIIGLLCLAGGYYIALSSATPVDAIMTFFYAVLLVIAGTFALFHSGSIALLKALKNNKKFYYTPNHFISVSGMLYRMRRNAAGLASICILCTMVLVTVSATVSLYTGQENSLEKQYSRDVTVRSKDVGDFPFEILRTTADEYAAQNNVTITDWVQTMMLRRYALEKDGVMTFNDADSALARVYFVPLEDYNNMVEAPVSLADDELIMFCTTRVYGRDTLTINDFTYTVVEEPESFPLDSRSLNSLESSIYLVGTNSEPFVSDLGAIDATDLEETPYYCFLGFNIDGTVEDSYAFAKGYVENTNEAYARAIAQSLELVRADWYSFNGGFLFIGIFLGALFMMATVLIIYYKQLSEGIEDRERFVILQKVGMSRSEVKKTINKQVLIVFFIPLIVSVIHTMVAFPALVKMEAIFYLDNVPLMLLCTGATILVFSILYVIAYRLTSNVYYKLVQYDSRA